MKHSLPLLALLTATLATPLLAQDMSAFLNPRALAAQYGLSGHTSAYGAAPQATLRGADAAAILGAMTAAHPHGVPVGVVETASYISSSPRPVMRPRLFEVSAAPRLGAEAGDLIERMAVSGPLGGNTVVVSGANTAVISGANTAIVRSSGVTSATVLRGESPRLTLWQRIFGL